jgi:hypothetical protein
MAKEKHVYVGIRMPQSMVEAIDAIAEKRGETRSDTFRFIGNNLGTFLRFIEEAEQERATLDGNVSEWFAQQIPEDITAGALLWFKHMINEAFEMKLKELTGEINKEGKI